MTCDADGIAGATFAVQTRSGVILLLCTHHMRKHAAYILRAGYLHSVIQMMPARGKHHASSVPA